jgi:hypothetical protein
MTGKKLTKAVVGTIAGIEGLLSVFRSAGWLDEHFPEALKPFIEPIYAVCMAIAAVLFIFKSDSGEKASSVTAPVDGATFNAKNLNIENLNLATSSGNASMVQSPPQAAPRVVGRKRGNGPKLIPIYTQNRSCSFPESPDHYFAMAAAFRNDAVSPSDEAVNITTHLTYRHRELGFTYYVNEAMWIERGMNSMDIFPGKTAHLVLAIHMDQSRPKSYTALDISYDSNTASWVTVLSYGLVYGRYDLDIEIKADNYRAFFKCEGELAEDKNDWTTPLEVQKAEGRGNA